MELIKLVSDDEVNVILEVADDAAKRMGWPPISKSSSADCQMPSIWTLQLRQQAGYGIGASIVELMNYFSPGTISRTDLTTLAPYIDDWINGNAPRFALPAEYDRRVEFLDSFKKRMVSTGAWPVGPMEKAKPRPAP